MEFYFVIVVTVLLIVSRRLLSLLIPLFGVGFMSELNFDTDKWCALRGLRYIFISEWGIRSVS